MPPSVYVPAIVAFILLVGYLGLAWLRRGREPVFADDPSILLPAPPPQMTAATATIVDGGPTHLAFMAALLDLASRDEIAFEEEGGDGRTARVGIAIHGTETTDPRILLNRRLPAGEGESWLLAQLKASVLIAAGEMGGRAREAGPPPLEAMQLGGQMLGLMMRMGASTADEDDSPEARVAREHGLLSGGPPDPAKLAEAIEARTGKPLSDRTRASLDRMATSMELLKDPAAIAADPDAFIARMEAETGKTATPEQLAELKTWAARLVAQPAEPRPEYIPAALAVHLEAPFLFGTLLQTYATRHGWLAGLPLMKRLRWRLTGLAEIGACLVLALLGSSLKAEVLTGLATGIGAAGLVTYAAAPAMTAKTREGAEMKAQLAAYRRTLQMTFGQARSMEEAVTSSGLKWLETPDQALVWGVALGLRRDIEALLARTADDLRQGRAPGGAYVPVWYRPASAAGLAAGPPPAGQPGPVAAAPGAAAVPAAIADAAAMFAGIEAIGSRPAGHA
jgi:hypothetical protein